MIRIVISAEAFRAITDTLPFGSVSYGPEIGPGGVCYAHPHVADKLKARQGPNESISDVITRLADEIERGSGGR
jgi:hypothetical protein